MEFRTFTDDELRARFASEPDNTALREEILSRFDYDELGSSLHQRIAELEDEVKELEKQLDDREDE